MRGQEASSTSSVTDPVIRAQEVSKSFGHFKALDRITFDVCRGDCLLLLGANGAGKTTLLKLMSGLSRPSGGRVQVMGIDLKALPAEARRHIGFLSHAPQLYAELSARENLRFFGCLFQVPDLARRLEEMLELVELRHRGRDLVRTFSRGMQQRLSIAKAFLHHPELILLDEPHSGLDPYAASVLNRLFEQYHSEGKTLIITTHNLEMPLRFANRVAILRRGQLAHWGPILGISAQELRELFDCYR
jgi:heme exporter protein A